MCSRNSVNLSELLTKMWMKFSASAFSILATPPVQTSKMSENYETLIYINMHINITNKETFKFDEITTCLPYISLWSTSGPETGKTQQMYVKYDLHRMKCNVIYIIRVPKALLFLCSLGHVCLNNNWYKK